jgi:hypothetical protein
MADGLESFKFTELHILPRVVFAIGTLLFISALVNHQGALGAFALGVIFIALTYNFFYDYVLNTQTLPPTNNPTKFRRERTALILHGFICLAFAVYFFHFAYTNAHARPAFPW